MVSPESVVKKSLDPGAKFVDGDLTPELRDAALSYLANYKGKFRFLWNLQSREPEHLTIGQIRGILNCIRAAVMRQDKVKN